MTNFEHNLGEGIFGEEFGNFITQNWYDYHSVVLNKYNRRIERFINIINDKKPIIVLCRYNTNDVIKLQQLFIKYYKNNNIYFVNSCNEPFENDYIKNVYTEKENKWNDVNIWKEGISDIIKKIK
jgi:hypothetical protein